MKKYFHSLQTKLTLSFVLLILSISLLTFYITFKQSTDSLKQIIRAELKTVSSMAAELLSGPDADLAKTLQTGQENTPIFAQLQQKLKRIQTAALDIKYIYIMRQDGNKVRFIVDPEFGNPEDPGGAINEEYEAVHETLLAGFTRVSADEEITVDKWGALLSGFAPLKDSNGTIIGLVGVDMAADLVLKKLKFLSYSVYAILLFGIFMAGIIILIFSKTIIKDIRHLNQVATDISLGNMDVELKIRRQDEIGELAESFNRMLVSLKIMMTQEK